MRIIELLSVLRGVIFCDVILIAGVDHPDGYDRGDIKGRSTP